MTNGTLRTLREFWEGFGRLPLYDTGFDDAIKQCGAHRAWTHEEAILSLSYLRGYADAARLACPYHGPSWRIADAMSCFTCTLLFSIGNDTLNATAAAGICRLLTIELAELCRQKSSPMGAVAGSSG